MNNTKNKNVINYIIYFMFYITLINDTEKETK